MRLYSSETTLDFSWMQLATAFWQRYPNIYAKHVLSEDTLFRKVTDDVIHSVRLLRKTNRLPKWGERWVKMGDALVVEESILNRHDQSIVTYTRNVDADSRRLLILDEKCSYTPTITIQSDKPAFDQTVLHRNAWFQCEKRGFGYLFEPFSLLRYKQNIQRTNLGIQSVLHRLYPDECRIRLQNGQKSTCSHCDVRMLTPENLQQKKKQLIEKTREAKEKLKHSVHTFSHHD